MANELKIVIIGGGSNSWTPTLVRDMLLTPSLSNAEYCLYDIDRSRSDLIAAFCVKLASQMGVKPKIISTDDRAAAFAGARYFIITLATGGLPAMAHDLRIPEDYSIYHTVGDTSGPGGWARTIRNFDAFVSLANDINRHADGAVVLNYTNPMATLTDVLCRLCHGPVVGLCHGLFENLRFITTRYHLQSEDEIAVQYGGLNHFFWITRARVPGVDVLADLSQHLRGRSFDDLVQNTGPDPMGFTSDRKVATELFHLTGVMPYLGDRHTCEFFPWYITNPARMEQYKLVRTTIAERQQWYDERDKDIRAMLNGQIKDEYFHRSRETAADIIDAHWRGKAFIDVGNLPNIGQISNLPEGVVETAVRVDANGFWPIAFGALPETARGFIEPHAHVYKMTVDACFRKDRKLAIQALRLDPTCAHLATPQVSEMADRLLAAHRSFISAF